MFANSKGGWNIQILANTNNSFINCNNMSYMFYGASNFNYITGLNTFNTINVNNMSYMFASCSKIKSIDISGWDMSNVLNISGMFKYSYNITHLELHNWNLSKVTNAFEFAFAMSNLQNFICNGSLNNCQNISNLFTYNPNLRYFIAPNLITNTTNTSNWSMHIAYNQPNLLTFNAANWDFPQNSAGWRFFGGCYNLRNINIDNWNFQNFSGTEYMFSECINLTTINNNSNWDLSKVRNTYYLD